ncbi:MAG: Hsp20/alpha crystallin family protein [Acidobacteriota bacterium]|nr:Hsp20/alpha crystallin family protein [Acidobacteriota bacterium]MDQ5836607.1 Hsp20/alpha crystallin family protein [Acidobacteriota bacterium]
MKRTLHATIFDRAELERLRGRVGRLFVALQEASEMVAGEAGAWLPPVDLCESEECVTVRVELPGVRAEQVEVALTNEQLRVRGRKRKGAPRGSITHLCSERSFGQFVRTVPLRWPVRKDAATAELKDGLLTVRLPKLEDRRGAEHKIEVKESDK